VCLESPLAERAGAAECTTLSCGLLTNVCLFFSLQHRKLEDDDDASGNLFFTFEECQAEGGGVFRTKQINLFVFIFKLIFDPNNLGPCPTCAANPCLFLTQFCSNVIGGYQCINFPPQPPPVFQPPPPPPPPPVFQPQPPPVFVPPPQPVFIPPPSCLTTQQQVQDAINRASEDATNPTIITLCNTVQIRTNELIIPGTRKSFIMNCQAFQALPREECILDALFSTRILAGAPQRAMFQNIIFQNGQVNARTNSDTDTQTDGGAMDIRGGSVRFEGCRFFSNGAERGAAILLQGDSPFVTAVNSQFSSNSATVVRLFLCMILFATGTECGKTANLISLCPMSCCAPFTHTIRALNLFLCPARRCCLRPTWRAHIGKLYCKR